MQTIFKLKNKFTSFDVCMDSKKNILIDVKDEKKSKFSVNLKTFVTKPILKNNKKISLSYDDGKITIKNKKLKIVYEIREENIYPANLQSHDEFFYGDSESSDSDDDKKKPLKKINFKCDFSDEDEKQKKKTIKPKIKSFSDSSDSDHDKNTNMKKINSNSDFSSDSDFSHEYEKQKKKTIKPKIKSFSDSSYSDDDKQKSLKKINSNSIFSTDSSKDHCLKDKKKEPKIKSDSSEDEKKTHIKPKIKSDYDTDCNSNSSEDEKKKPIKHKIKSDINNYESDSSSDVSLNYYDVTLDEEVPTKKIEKLSKKKEPRVIKYNSIQEFENGKQLSNEEKEEIFFLKLGKIKFTNDKKLNIEEYKKREIEKIEKIKTEIEPYIDYNLDSKLYENLKYTRNSKKTEEFKLSLDEKIIAVTNISKKIFLFDCDTGEKLTELQSYPGWVSNINFSPDTKFIICYGSHYIELWNISDLKNINLIPIRLYLSNEKINKVIFSPDSKKIYSCSNNNEIIEWNISDLKNIKITKLKDSKDNIFPDNLNENLIIEEVDFIKNFEITNCGNFLVFFVKAIEEEKIIGSEILFFDILSGKVVHSMENDIHESAFFSEDNVFFKSPHQLDVLNIKFLFCKNRRKAFLETLCAKETSPIKDFHENYLFDKNILPIIFDFVK